MNKSVLPVSFDSLPLAKSPAKKTGPDVSRHDSFAEHLSQSQRELARDKPVNKTTKTHEPGDRQKPKTNATEAHASQKKQITNKFRSQEKPAIQNPPGENVSAEKKMDKDQVKAESVVTDSETSESAGTKVMGTHVLDASDIGKSEAEKNLDSDADPIVLMDPALILSQEKPLVEITDEQVDVPLQVTGMQVSEIEVEPAGNLFISDTKKNASEIAPEVDLLLMASDTNTESPGTFVNDKTILEKLSVLQQESSEAEKNPQLEIVNTPGLEKLIPVDPTLEQAAIPLAAVSLTTASVAPGNQAAVLIPMTEEIVAGKTGMDLPHQLLNANDEGEADNNLLEMGDFTGDIKMEDKSSKSDLFKSLMQLQTEKTPVAEKPATFLAPQVAPLTTAQVATANRLFVPQTQLGVSVAHPNWNNAVGEKILWMANQQLSSADIRLDPPELGSLQVKVNMQQDQASITFISPHPQVRELLDQQVTRLREMFAEQGLNLVNVDVADRHEHQSRHADDESRAKGNFVNDETNEVEVTAVSSLYLVDQFV